MHPTPLHEVSHGSCAGARVMSGVRLPRIEFLEASARLVASARRAACAICVACLSLKLCRRASSSSGQREAGVE